MKPEGTGAHLAAFADQPPWHRAGWRRERVRRSKRKQAKLETRVPEAVLSCSCPLVDFILLSLL